MYLSRVTVGCVSDTTFAWHSLNFFFFAFLYVLHLAGWSASLFCRPLKRSVALKWAMGPFCPPPPPSLHPGHLSFPNPAFSLPTHSNLSLAFRCPCCPCCSSTCALISILDQGPQATCYKQLNFSYLRLSSAWVVVAPTLLRLVKKGIHFTLPSIYYKVPSRWTRGGKEAPTTTTEHPHFSKSAPPDWKRLFFFFLLPGLVFLDIPLSTIILS